MEDADDHQHNWKVVPTVERPWAAWKKIVALLLLAGIVGVILLDVLWPGPFSGAR